MKVLMIASWYSPKDAETMFAGVFHYEQSMALKKYCETALYFPYDTSLKSNFEKSVENGLLTYRTKMKSVKISKISGAIHLLKTLCHLDRICKDYNPDVIHAHCGIAAGRIATIFAKLRKIPVVITEHSPIEQMELDRKLYKKKLHAAYATSDANVCVSKDSMNRIGEHFPDCRFNVIYNGIYSPEAVGNDGVNYRVDGKINCCIVAAFYSKDIKGYQFLIPAIAELKKQGLPIVLHVVGGGDYFDYYVNMAKELDVEDAIIFYGNCEKKKVYSLVSQMDFNISASIYECSGVSVEEALLLGRPMLVTKSGGANSLVNDKVAIVVDRGSTEALVNGINKMVEKLPEFDQKEIYNYAFENFEIDQVSQKYMKLYNSVLENKND